LAIRIPIPNSITPRDWDRERSDSESQETGGSPINRTSLITGSGFGLIRGFAGFRALQGLRRYANQQSRSGEGVDAYGDRCPQDVRARQDGISGDCWLKRCAIRVICVPRRVPRGGPNEPVYFGDVPRRGNDSLLRGGCCPGCRAAAPPLMGAREGPSRKPLPRRRTN